MKAVRLVAYSVANSAVRRAVLTVAHSAASKVAKLVERWADELVCLKAGPMELPRAVYWAARSD